MSFRYSGACCTEIIPAKSSLEANPPPVPLPKSCCPILKGQKAEEHVAVLWDESTRGSDGRIVLEYQIIPRSALGPQVVS